MHVCGAEPSLGIPSTGEASQWLLMISLRKAALILPTTGVVDSKTALEWLVNEAVP